MLKLEKTIATLILFATTLVGVGGTASASTSSVWADSVNAASTLAESAKFHISRSNDCQGLGKLLELGPSASGDSPSDALGVVRSELLEMDVLAATVKFATIESGDAAAREASLEAYMKITGFRSDVTRTLVTRLHYCGNGVEKGPK